jgi:hypothetical protein
MSSLNKRIQAYTFNAAAKTITFTGYASINYEGVLLIQNKTTNQLIHQFNKTGAGQTGGSVAGNVFTFTAPNTGMANGDKLFISYDDSVLPDFATQTTLNDILLELRDDTAFSETVWYDKITPTLFYVRTATVNQDTGVKTVSFQDASGAAATPIIANLVQINSQSGISPVTYSYRALTNGTGYVLDDMIQELRLVTVAGAVQTTVWFNRTQNTIISAPVFSDLAPATEAATAINQFSEITKLSAIDSTLQITQMDPTNPAGVPFRSTMIGGITNNGEVKTIQSSEDRNDPTGLFFASGFGEFGNLSRRHMSTGKSLPAAEALDVSIVDANGDQIVSFGTADGATATLQVAEQVLIGAVTETAPASDTASSGLNGRLQRVAQNLTTVAGKLPVVNPASTAVAATAVSMPVSILPNNNSVKITDGTNVGTIKAASTASVATDTSIVVALSPNSNKIASNITDGAAAGTVINVMGAKVVASIPTLTAGNAATLISDVGGRLLVKDAATAPTNAVIPTSGLYIAGSVTTAAPTYTTATLNGLSLNTAGDLRTISKINDGTNSVTLNPASTVVAAAAVSVPVAILPNNNSIKITDGTSTSAINPASTVVAATVASVPVSILPNNNVIKVSDGTNTSAVKAASTAPLATDPALVVSISPNTPTVGVIGAATAPVRMNVFGGVFNTTPPVLTTGQSASIQLDANSKLITRAALAETVYVQSTSNNTAAQLAAAATFTGTIESALSYPQVVISIRCDQPYTLVVDQFSDAAGTIQYSPSITYTRAANVTFNQPINLSGSYYRTKITNNGVAATTTLFSESFLGILPPLPNLDNNGNFPVFNSNTGSGNLNQYSQFRTETQLATVTTVKASKGNIYGINIINPNTVPVYLKFFDAAAPVVGTTAPVEVIAVPASGAVMLEPNGSVISYYQTNSIKMAAVTGLLTASVAAPVTALTVEIKYI